ncbi:MAG TPA: cytochrome P450 [Pyrinomonadaceae bacterium]|nr:cytochrome P450 [Pyrinomonadaceae bacterium]
MLSDIDLFGMPVSAAERLSLPQNLVNLNRGLHSMRGEQHAQHQRLLLQTLVERNIGNQHSAVCAGLETFAQGWRSGQHINLLGEMRRLTLEVSTRLLFGDQYTESSRLALLLQSYFLFRREVASPFHSAGETLREELISLGALLDGEFRRYIRWCRKRRVASSDGVLTRLASLELEQGRRLSEDELIAHGNVLFMSSNEPIAVALTWILLILSQAPGLRRELRREIGQAARADAMPSFSELARLTQLDSVINETLRLLPPNALMVRVTTRPTTLQDVRLPERCELVLCPFLAHRDAESFPRPNEFLPSRWNGIRPAPFEFFPFGAGGHACVGRHLATYMIKSALALLMPRYELVLAGDQEIDWRIHIQFMPRNDPLMTVHAPGRSTLRSGKLFGPVSEMISLGDGEP